MKKMILVTSIVLLMSAAVVSVFAAGGKVRGEKGQGQVEQVQEPHTDDCNPYFDR